MDGVPDADAVKPQPPETEPASPVLSDPSPAPHTSLQRLVSGLRLVSLLTLVSRILGLVRDMLMAATFGNSVVLDAFTVAFRIPNMARRLFGEGALTTAFLPLFVREAEQVGLAAAWRLATSVLVVLSIVLCGVVLVGEGILCIAWLQLGRDADIAFLIELTAIMLPYLVTICLAAQVSAILNANHHFAWPAIVPTLLNALWIAALVFLVPAVPSGIQMHVVAATIVVGGVVQLIAPWPALKRVGFEFHLDLAATGDRLRELIRSMLPVLVGLSITQLNTIADSLIAWFCATESLVSPESVWSLETGTASALYFGQRMYQFPLGIFGVALGTVLFPRFTRDASRRNWEALRGDLETGLKLILAIGLPASAGLVLLSEPMTRLLFEHGEFSSEDSRQTTWMIMAYGTGVWAYCGLLIISRAFYAVEDRMTPLVAGILALCLNLPLNFAMIRLIGAPGLALATSLSAAFQLALLIGKFHHRVTACRWSHLLDTLVRVAVATAIMAAVGFVILQQLPATGGTLIQFWRTSIPLCGSVLVYMLAARFLRIHVLWLLIKRDAASPQL